MGWSTRGLSWVGLDWVGSRFFKFLWVGFGRGSETTEAQKLKKIHLLNVSTVDTDGRGVRIGKSSKFSYQIVFLGICSSAHFMGSNRSIEL